MTGKARLITPAKDVTVVAYYIIPYNAIVNQCWDLHRTYLHSFFTLSRKVKTEGQILSNLKKGREDGSYVEKLPQNSAIV